MTSELQRVARGLVDSLDQMPQVVAHLQRTAHRCRQNAAAVVQMTRGNRQGREIADGFQAAARACDQAVEDCTRAHQAAREWAVQKASGVSTAEGTGPSRTDVSSDDGSSDGNETDGGHARFDPEVWALVPERVGDRGKTVGRFVDADGALSDEIVSGYQGRASELPTPRTGTGMNRHNVSHVEAHTAATMRLDGKSAGTLYVNNPPCPGPVGCEKWLPHMLPPGGILTVYGPKGFCRVYRGVSSKERAK